MLVVIGYNVKYVCVDVLGALLLLPEGFRCILGQFLLYWAPLFIMGVPFIHKQICWGVFLIFPSERFFLFSIDLYCVESALYLALNNKDFRHFTEQGDRP